MIQLEPADYPQVRVALDVTVDDVLLDDDTIGSDIYAGRAERYVSSLMSGNETAEEVVLYHSALILFTAAYIAPSMPSIIAYRYGPVSMERVHVDWAKRRDVLWEEASRIISNLNGRTRVIIGATFTTAKGPR